MQRRTKVTAIVFGTFVFLGLSFLLTRALVGAGNERAQVVEVVRAQVRGDADAVLAQLPECRKVPICVEQSRARTQRLRRPGEVQVLTYTPSVQVALLRTRGFARIAWRTREVTTPVVQCVRVEREGPLTGAGVRLIAIGDPQGGEASC